MTEQFYFNVFRPTGGSTLAAQLEELDTYVGAWLLANALEAGQVLQARVYLTDAIGQWPVVCNHPLLTATLAQVACSYVEQPLLTGEKVAVQLWATNAEVQPLPCPTSGCRICRVGQLKYLFHTVRFAADEVRGLNAEQQTELAFEHHIEVLRREGLNLRDHCRRTWIYVRDVDRLYAGVVKGRNEVFAREGLTADTHYIASTGIGGYTDNAEAVVGIDFLSIDGLPEANVRYLQALDYLNHTHEYGVAFERATALDMPCGRLALVSGTASIDREGRCVHQGDVMTQTGRLFLNIEKLLDDGGLTLNDLRYIIVYLRDIADAPAVLRYLRLRFPALPMLLTEARVCRPEWLIEVEGIAVGTLAAQ